MALTNAERQKLFRQRVKAKANSGLYEIFLREWRDNIGDRLKRFEAERAILEAVLAEPPTEEEVDFAFSELVGELISRRRRTLRKRRGR